LGEVIKRYKKVLVPELNMGPIALGCCERNTLVDAVGLNKNPGPTLSNTSLSLSKKIEENAGRVTRPML